MPLASENAEKIMNALSAFKSYKKPKNLPDRLRLSRKHLQSVRRWRNMARKKLKKGTFTSLTQLVSYLPFDDSDEENVDIATNKTVTSPPVKMDASLPGSLETSLLELDSSMFPDVFNVARNDWDSDWESDEEDTADLLFGDPYGNSVKKSQIKYDSKFDSNMEAFADSMGTFAESILPSTQRFMAKDICYEPYKRAKDVFETWLEENRGSLSQDVLREKEKQYQLFKEIVDVYEKMDDEDDEEKHRNDMKKVQALMSKISTASGVLPDEVQAAQDEAAAGILAESQDILTSTFEEILPQMGKMVAGIMESVVPIANAGREEEETEEEESNDCTIL